MNVRPHFLEVGSTERVWRASRPVGVAAGCWPEFDGSCWRYHLNGPEQTTFIVVWISLTARDVIDVKRTVIGSWRGLSSWPRSRRGRFGGGLVREGVTVGYLGREADERPGAAPVGAMAVARAGQLLVLDEFEDEVDAAPLPAGLRQSLLARVPATSRTVLWLRGEHELRVLPLPAPARGRPGRCGAYASVNLFVRRTYAAALGFELTDENAEAVAEICRRLKGLAPAIGLAAASVQLLPPQELLTRLGRRFGVLPAGRDPGTIHLVRVGLHLRPCRLGRASRLAMLRSRRRRVVKGAVRRGLITTQFAFAGSALAGCAGGGYKRAESHSGGSIDVAIVGPRSSKRASCLRWRVT
jgi:hypothetical protein